MTLTDENSLQPDYSALSPDLLLDAVDAFGLRSDGRFLALNSYENRVYQFGIEDSGFVVGKFYRPGRWSDDAIREEHAFAFELEDQEIPVVAPLRNSAGESLLHHGGYRYALFPRRGGRWPDLDDPDKLEWTGRFLGRIHAVGASKPFIHRPNMRIEDLGVASYQYLLAEGFIPEHVELAYRTLCEDLITGVKEAFARAGDPSEIRLHGDCHPGNILWTDDGPHFVDLDDCRTGPAIQDLWMLLSGDRQEMSLQLSDLLEGYEQFHSFPLKQLHLIEALRTLRMMHYAAWLARRWTDPAFPLAFPWFNTPRYWEEHVLSLREQAASLSEPPLQV